MAVPRAADLVREFADFVAQHWSPVDRFISAYHKVYVSISCMTVHQVTLNDKRTTKAREDLDGEEIRAEVLRHLDRHHGKDLIERMGEIAQESIADRSLGRRFWELHTAYCTALPELKFDSEALTETLEAILEFQAGGGGSFKLCRSIEDLSGKSEKVTKDLLSAFLSRPTSKVVSLVPPVLTGLSKLHFEEAHRQAMGLTREAQPELRRAGLLTLSFLDYPDKSETLQTTVDLLDELVTTEDPELTPTLARACGQLLDSCEKSSEWLVQLARTDASEQTHLYLAATLSRRAKKDSQEPWFRQVLNSLASVSTNASSILDDVDDCLIRYLNSEPRFIVNFLERFIQSRSYSREGETLPDLLPNAMTGLYQSSRALLETTITNWFASTDDRLNKAAWDIAAWPVQKATNADPEYPHLQLRKSVLESLDNATFARVIRRVLGYGFHFQPLAALLTSALSRGPMPPEFGPPFEAILFKELLYSYPASGRKYLESRLTDEALTDFERDTIEEALVASKTYYDALENLPRLRELMPPDHRLAQVRRAMQKQQTIIREKAMQQSPLLSMITPIPIKYGKKAFRAGGKSFSEPIKMGTFSASIELTRRAVIEPVREHRERRLHRCSDPQEETE